jgi:hypothetical protein
MEICKDCKKTFSSNYLKIKDNKHNYGNRPYL